MLKSHASDGKYLVSNRKLAHTRILENTGIAPRFLGHIHEHGRVMGFVLEKVEGRLATIEDLSCCRSVLQRLHDHGLVHGDINKYNFIVHDDKVRLIGFEKSQFCPDDAESMQNEVESLRGQLMEETGRGGGLRFVEESCKEIYFMQEKQQGSVEKTTSSMHIAH